MVGQSHLGPAQNFAVQPIKLLFYPMNATIDIRDVQTALHPEPGDGINTELTRSFPRRMKAEAVQGGKADFLDNLVRLASSMVLRRNKLVRLAEKETSSGQELRSVVQEINLVTSEMQDAIMRARLHPIGDIFVKSTPIGRNLGQKLNKHVQFDIVGDDVELDRMLLEGLVDPLARLVRNCVEHGIESPEERIAAGKPDAGRIRLAAVPLDGHVHIEVRDDGRGIDLGKIKATAVEKRLISPETASHMTDIAAFRTLLTAGFFTHSDTAAMWVSGMEVIKDNIEKLGGDVELASELGRGTSVFLRLPRALATVPALLVSCGGHSLAVPQINLEEVVVPGPSCPLESLGSSLVIRLREELVPVLDLAAIFGRSQPAPERRSILVLQLDHARFGLLVDDISDTEEIVVNPLACKLKAAPICLGSPLLGAGDSVLILDPTALAQKLLPTIMPNSPVPQPPRDSLSRPKSERVLVFSDASPEYFALHLSSLARVEHVPASRIERINGRDCLRQENGPTLQLIRPGNYLPAAPPAPYGTEVFVIVPKMNAHPVGIIASAILDITDLETATLDREIFASPALLGTSPLRERLTLVIDINGLLRAANFAPPQK